MAAADQLAATAYSCACTPVVVKITRLAVCLVGIVPMGPGPEAVKVGVVLQQVLVRSARFVDG